MNDPLDWMIRRLRRLIDAATASLEELFPRGVDAWEDAVAEQLRIAHAAAFLAGSGQQTLEGPARVAIERTLAQQIGFLRQFGVAIRDGAAWERGWNARARMYAGAISAPYWTGKTRMLPLPAMPTEGTQCMSNCRCSWEVVPVDESAGDYDAYWRLGSDDQCQTCTQRAADWSPVQIRGGVLQL